MKLTEKQHGALSSAIYVFVETYTICSIFNGKISWENKYILTGIAIAAILSLCWILATLVLLIFPISENWDKMNNVKESREFLDGWRYWDWTGAITTLVILLALSFVINPFLEFYVVKENLHVAKIGSSTTVVLAGIIPVFIALLIEFTRMRSYWKGYQ